MGRFAKYFEGRHPQLLDVGDHPAVLGAMRTSLTVTVLHDLVVEELVLVRQ